MVDARNERGKEAALAADGERAQVAAAQTAAAAGSADAASGQGFGSSGRGRARRVAGAVCAIVVCAAVALACAWGAGAISGADEAAPTDSAEQAVEAEAPDETEADSAQDGDAADGAAQDGGEGSADTGASGDDETEAAAEGAIGDAGSSSDVSAPSSPSAAPSGESAQQSEAPIEQEQAPARAAVSVTVSIDASNAHAYDSAWPSSYGTYTVQVPDGASAYDALVATGAAVSSSGTGYGVYVRGINGLAEFSCGNSSGWLYLVDGVTPAYSAGKYQLHGGETVRWAYTVREGDV